MRSLTEKRCGVCHETKPVEEFYFNKKTGKPIYACKPCELERGRRERAERKANRRAYGRQVARMTVLSCPEVDGVEMYCKGGKFDVMNVAITLRNGYFIPGMILQHDDGRVFEVEDPEFACLSKQVLRNTQTEQKVYMQGIANSLKRLTLAEMEI